jgi:hypothetical protein
METISMTGDRSGTTVSQFTPREGESPIAHLGAQLGMQFGRRFCLDQRLTGNVAIDDGVIAMGEGMYLVARKYGEYARLVGRRELIEVTGPQGLQPREAFDVKIDDMGDARIVDRHVGPVGVAGDGNEIELPARPAQRLIQRAVTIGNAAMIMDVAIPRPQAEPRGQRRQSFRQAFTDHAFLRLPPKPPPAVRPGSGRYPSG